MRIQSDSGTMAVLAMDISRFTSGHKVTLLLTRARQVDWILLSSALLLVFAGLLTMNSFVEENFFFEKQLIWMSIGVVLFFVLSFTDFHFLRRRAVIVGLFVAIALVLAALLFFGEIIRGTQSRFDLGLFDIQPSDPAKLILILLLAKYFSRRHVAIAQLRHIFISGLYTFVLFVGLANKFPPDNVFANFGFLMVDLALKILDAFFEHLLLVV